MGRGAYIRKLVYLKKYILFSNKTLPTTYQSGAGQEWTHYQKNKVLGKNDKYLTKRKKDYIDVISNDYRVWGRLVCSLAVKEWGSLNFLFSVLLFLYKRTQLFPLAAACLVYRDGMGSSPEAWWWLTWDWGPLLALPGWPPGCFLMASRTMHLFSFT